MTLCKLEFKESKYSSLFTTYYVI